MPFLGMPTVGDLSDQELARIGREAIERTLRGPQGIPTAAQRDFAVQVYRQIAPQLTPENLSRFGEFLQPYFQASAGTRPTYATLQKARPLFLSQLEATGGEVEAVSPWLRAVAQPLQDRAGMTASAALNERAWQQAMEGLGGWVRDPETGQLVPTAETQRALALAYLASIGQTDSGLSQLLGDWYTQITGTTGAAPAQQPPSVQPEPQFQLTAPVLDAVASAKSVLSSGSAAGEDRIVRSAADAARRATAGTQAEAPNWQIPSFWRRLAASFTPGGTDRLAPSEDVVRQLQEEFATPQEAFQAVNEALRQAEQQPGIDPNLLQILRSLREWLAEKAIIGNFWDWRTHVPLMQPGW